MNLNKKLLALVGKTEVIHFAEVWESNGDIGDKIAIGQDVGLVDTYHIVETFGLNYLVQSNDDNFTYNLLMTAIINKFPDAFLKNPLPTILRSTAANEGSSISIPFRSSEQKGEVMGKIREFIAAYPRLASVQTNVSLIINELMMNALYCAPTDDSGTHLYRDANRSVIINYPEGKNAEITLSFNQDLLVVGCRDPYGSVEKSTVTNRLHEVFQIDQKVSVRGKDPKAGGSGLGIKMCIENSTGFGMVVKKNAETFVYAILPLGKGNRAIARMPKNLALKFYS